MPVMITSTPVVVHSGLMYAGDSLTITDKVIISGFSLAILLVLSAFIVMVVSDLRDESICKTTKSEKIVGSLFIASLGIGWLGLLIFMIAIWFQ